MGWNLGIRTLFMKTKSHMQKSIELRIPLIEASTCLYPGEKIKALSIQKMCPVGSNMPCVNPEELALWANDWRESNTI